MCWKCEGLRGIENRLPKAQSMFAMQNRLMTNDASQYPCEWSLRTSALGESNRRKREYQLQLVTVRTLIQYQQSLGKQEGEDPEMSSAYGYSRAIFLECLIEQT